MDLPSRAGGRRGVDAFYAIAAAILNAEIFGAGLQIDFGLSIPSSADFIRRTLASLRAGSHICVWLGPTATACGCYDEGARTQWRRILGSPATLNICTYPNFFNNSFNHQIEKILTTL